MPSGPRSFLADNFIPDRRRCPTQIIQGLLNPYGKTIGDSVAEVTYSIAQSHFGTGLSE